MLRTGEPLPAVVIVHAVAARAQQGAQVPGRALAAAVPTVSSAGSEAISGGGGGPASVG